MSRKLRVVNGTTYHDETPDAVVAVLERAREDRRRIRVRYGKASGPEAGLDWLEEHDVEGYVGRSMGTEKIPLLVHNARSLGGGGILDHCIVRVIDTRTGEILYSHPKYRRPKLTIKRPGTVLADGKVHAQFELPEQAERWVRKMSL